MKKKMITSVMSVITVVLFVLFDQWTKHLSVLHLKNQTDISLVKNVLDLKYLENKGAAWGIFQNQIIFFGILTVVIVLAIIYVFARLPFIKHYVFFRITLILLTAGAIGNFIDRMINHYVVDFIYFKLINFPIFNVADIYVTCAAAMLFIGILFIYKEEDFKWLKKKSKQ